MKPTIKYIAAIALCAISISSKANNATLDTENLSLLTNGQAIEKGKVKLNTTPVNEQTTLKISEIARMFPEAVVTRYKMVPAGKNNFRTVKTQEVDYESLASILARSVFEQQAATMRFRK